MAKTSAKSFKVDKQSKEDFVSMTNDLYLLTGAWAWLFIEFEMRHIEENNRVYLPLPVYVSKYLEHQHEKKELCRYDIQLSEEQTNKLKDFCDKYNISKHVFVDAVFCLAVDRIQRVNTKKLRIAEIDPITRLRLFVKRKPNDNEHFFWLKDNIFLDKYVVPKSFRDKYPES